jgi:GxxExxY protein
MKPKGRLFQEKLTGEIIGAAIEVHQQLGPGLLESTYQACLARELELRGVSFEYEKPLPFTNLLKVDWLEDRFTH